MDETVARSIVNEARSRGIDVPEGTDDVDRAKALLRMASSAYDQGVRGADTEAIMVMGGLLERKNGEPMDPPSSQLEEPPVANEEPGPPTEDLPLAQVRIEGFPVPPDPEGEPPEMPRDLTLISDRECRKLHAEFNAWLVRVLYLIGIEKSDLAGAEAMRDRALRDAKKAARTKLQEDDPKVSQAAINSRAEEDPEYEKWSARLIVHQAKLSQLYAFRDIYSGNVERLSRDWRMRVDEYQMSGGGQRR